MNPNALYLVVSETAAADNEVLAAVQGYRFIVLSYSLNAGGGANTVTWKSAATAIAGPYTVADDDVWSEADYNGLFETQEGEALNLALTAATVVSGRITYLKVPMADPISSDDLAGG